MPSYLNVDIKLVIYGVKYMRLVFVRHGEPDYDNDTLTENGLKQAEMTAERLQDEGISAIFSSPMGRAVKTASFTADKLGLDIEKLDFMHEIDWGSKDGSEIAFNGHPWSLSFNLLAENPTYLSGSYWKEHPYFKNNKCLDYYLMISKEFDKFLERFGLYRKGALYEAKSECNDTIALFAHGGSGGVMFAHLLNLSFPYVMTALPYGVCSVSIIEFEPKLKNMVVPRLELFNDMGHLDKVKLEPLRFEK